MFRTVEFLFSLFVLLTGLSCIGCENSHYVDLMTRGLQPPPQIPEELQDVITTITQVELENVLQLVQASNLLRSGSKDTLLDTYPSQGQAPIPSVNPECLNDTAHVVVGLLTGQGWALQMLDSDGKPGSGLLELQIVFLGTYDECIKVKVNQTINNVTSQMFRGRYCKASVPLAQQAQTGAQTPPLGLYLGLCFPDSCQGEDVTLILNSMLDMVLKQVNITTKFKFGPTVCQDENLPWDTEAIAVFVLAMLFVVVLVLGTLYDIVFIQVPHWSVLCPDSEAPINSDIDANTSMNIKRDLGETAPLLSPENKTPPRRTEPSMCGKLLLSFSVYTNTGKLFNTRRSPGSLDAVHGIRFLSMSWVILGHVFAFGLGYTDNLLSYAMEIIKRFTFQAIANASVSVDSFFTLSGLLVSYLVLKEMRRSGGKINWFMFYFHRFWRLTPPYMLLMMVYVPLFPYLTTGPLWSQAGLEINKCRNSWWTNLLYVNNLVRTKEMCMGWSWYLANDMQFYIVSPLIFVPLFFSGILGTISVLVFLVAILTTAGVISRVNNLSASFLGDLNPSANATDQTNAQMTYFFDYYITPYCRMGPYIIGMVTGYFLYRTDCKIRLNKWLVLGGWCVATASALAVLYGLYGLTQGDTITADVAAFYNSVHRTVWGACLCWVVFACATGYGGFVNTLLSWPALIPLSRLTYCAYLVHPIVIFFYYTSSRVLFHTSDISIVYSFFGVMVSSYMVAFMVSMAFEAPMMGLEKVFLKREKSS